MYSDVFIVEIPSLLIRNDKAESLQSYVTNTPSNIKGIHVGLARSLGCFQQRLTRAGAA